MMAMRVEFSEIDAEIGECRIVIRIDDIVVRSYPQGIGDHFRDLKANIYFLSKKQLAKLFFGEEPLVNISYIGDDLARAYVGKKLYLGSEELSGEFSLVETLSYLRGILDALEVALSILHIKKEAIVAQIEDDISLGVYNVYLRDVA